MDKPDPAEEIIKKRKPPRWPMKLNDLCERIGVNERDARYVLARGAIPPGMEPTPGRGRHRTFSPRQAFWLSIVLRLRAAGLSTEFAGAVATWAEWVRWLSVKLGWDPDFSPFDGQLSTEMSWVLEVGDGHLVRINTNAKGRRHWMDLRDWSQLRTTLLERDARPVVVLRVNLGELARMLQGERTLQSDRRPMSEIEVRARDSASPRPESVRTARGLVFDDVSFEGPPSSEPRPLRGLDFGPSPDFG